MPNHNTDKADGGGESANGSPNTPADSETWREQPRSKTGEFGSELTLEALRNYLNEIPPGAGTGEIAEEFGISSDTVRRRCRELANEGELVERDVGPSIFWQVVYW